jgi:hypothetical protein
MHAYITTNLSTTKIGFIRKYRPKRFHQIGSRSTAAPMSTFVMKINRPPFTTHALVVSTSKFFFSFTSNALSNNALQGRKFTLTFHPGGIRTHNPFWSWRDEHAARVRVVIWYSYDKFLSSGNQWVFVDYWLSNFWGVWSMSPAVPVGWT